MESFDDAATDLLMLDTSEDKVFLNLGSCFIEASEEEATEHCETEVEKNQSLIDILTEEEVDILAQHKVLKINLYARFGKSINLEDQ